MESFEFQFATKRHSASIKALLSACDLPHDDIDKHLPHFIIAQKGDELAGVVGLEIIDSWGLLRSLAVADVHRGQGLAKALYARILAHAHQQGVKTLFLLTLTVESFFSKLGFQSIQRAEVPEPLLATEEFVELCPETATCMMKRIDEDVRYFPRDMLQTQPDIAGVNLWAVGLKNVMFTYFEVDPHSRFEWHSHESEQITMVLEGTLHFEVDDQTIAVQANELIAIPSNVPHAVFTKETFVRAVDAWSPIMEKYKG